MFLFLMSLRLICSMASLKDASQVAAAALQSSFTASPAFPAQHLDLNWIHLPFPCVILHLHLGFWDFSFINQADQ